MWCCSWVRQRNIIEPLSARKASISCCHLPLAHYEEGFQRTFSESVFVTLGAKYSSFHHFPQLFSVLASRSAVFNLGLVGWIWSLDLACDKVSVASRSAMHIPFPILCHATDPSSPVPALSGRLYLLLAFRCPSSLPLAAAGYQG